MIVYGLLLLMDFQLMNFQFMDYIVHGLQLLMDFQLMDFQFMDYIVYGLLLLIDFQLMNFQFPVSSRKYCTTNRQIPNFR